MKKTEQEKSLLEHYFKALPDFSLGEIKMFEILDETSFSVFSSLKNRSLKEIMLIQNDIIYYFEKLYNFIPNGEKITTLIPVPEEENLLTKKGDIFFDFNKKSNKDLPYAIAEITKKDNVLSVACKYPEEPLLLEKGEKILVVLNKKNRSHERKN